MSVSSAYRSPLRARFTRYPNSAIRVACVGSVIPLTTPLVRLPCTRAAAAPRRQSPHPPSRGKRAPDTCSASLQPAFQSCRLPTSLGSGTRPPSMRGFSPAHECHAQPAPAVSRKYLSNQLLLCPLCSCFVSFEDGVEAVLDVGDAVAELPRPRLVVLLLRRAHE